MARRFAEHGKVYVIRKGEAGEVVPKVERTVVIHGRDLRQLSGQDGKTISSKLKTNPFLRYFLKMRQAYPFVYLTDDGGKDYRQKAFEQACRLIENEKVLTIFSSFRPWSDHLVARQLKQRYPQLKWVADFRDLPVDQVRKDIWWPALQRCWGKQVIALADELWVVSEGQQQQLVSWHPSIQVERNPLLRLPPAENNPVTERFTITYTGSLYPELQSAVALVSALNALLDEEVVSPEKLCLQYRGKDADLFREWTAELPEQCLDIQPSIAPAAAQKMQQEAQILLLLNWSAPEYYGVLTAKLWDYLATGRPILALVNGPQDQELSEIVLGAAAGAVFAKGEQGVVEWLREAYAQWLGSGSLPWRVNRQALEKYLPSADS